MNSEQQAKFFNSVANITSKWNSRFYLQLEHISDEEVLSDEARRLMQLIGEYGPKQSTQCSFLIFD